MNGSGSGGALQYSFSASKTHVGSLRGSVNANGNVEGSYNFLAVIHGDKLQSGSVHDSDGRKLTP